MSHKGMISAAQIRAARGLLDWSRKRLSEESGVPFSTLSDFEVGRSSAVLTTTADKLVEAFARHGVVFIGTIGVSFKEDQHKAGGVGVREKRASE
jgi:hypothetical protein